MKFKLQIILTSLAAFLFASLFVVTIVHSAFYAPEEEVAPHFSPTSRVHLLKTEKTISQSAEIEGVKSPPQRIIIPSIGVNAYVQKVGITKSGNMGIPTNFSDAGWYKYGPLPGNQGSAVIAGHVDNALALDGVFKHVAEITPGTKIKIITEDGHTVRFVVYDTQTYPYDQAPVELIFNKNDDAYLNLITCGGKWVQSIHSYDQRIVIFAKRSPDNTDSAVRSSRRGNSS